MYVCTYILVSTVVLYSPVLPSAAVALMGYPIHIDRSVHTSVHTWRAAFPTECSTDSTRQVEEVSSESRSVSLVTVCCAVHCDVLHAVQAARKGIRYVCLISFCIEETSQ